MIIDFHTHYGQGMSKTGFSLGFMLKAMKREKIDRSVIFAIKDNEGIVDYTLHNRKIVKVCSGKPLIGFMRVNCLSRDSTIKRNIAEGVELGLKGIKIHPRDDGWKLSSFTRICEAAEEHGLPVLMHSESMFSKFANIDRLVMALKSFKKNRFVLAHARVSPFVAEAMSKNRNIFIDTSLGTHVIDIKRLLNANSRCYRQVLFASDYPFALQSYEKKKLVDILTYLGKKQYLKDIMGGNAQRLLGI